MGVGDGYNGVGVMVSMGKDVKAGVVAVMSGCVSIGVEEGSIIGKPCGVHAEQRIRMKRKTRDFIFAFHEMC
jgi:hypothetical protein